MAPKLPRHKQRDMNARLRHHDTGINVGVRHETKAERRASAMRLNERVKLSRALPVPSRAKSRAAKLAMVEIIYLRA
jgi:hypothetical protein